MNPLKYEKKDVVRDEFQKQLIEYYDFLTRGDFLCYIHYLGISISDGHQNDTFNVVIYFGFWQTELYLNASTSDESLRLFITGVFHTLKSYLENDFRNIEPYLEL